MGKISIASVHNIEEEADLSSEELPAVLAHELNSPLSVIQLITTQMLEEGSALDEQTRKKLLMVQKSAQRMTYLVRDTLALSRPASIEFQVTPLIPVIDEAVNSFEILISASRIQFKFSHLKTNVVVHGVSEQLVQVLLNLLKNALDSVEEAKPEAGQIHLGFFLQGDSLFATVEDNGTGIPKENRKKVFEPFYSTKPKTKGTGLGLSICRSIAKSHGGELYFAESENLITKVVLKLPIIRAVS